MARATAKWKAKLEKRENFDFKKVALVFQYLLRFSSNWPLKKTCLDPFIFILDTLGIFSSNLQHFGTIFNVFSPNCIIYFLINNKFWSIYINIGIFFILFAAFWAHFARFLPPNETFFTLNSKIFLIFFTNCLYF